MGGGGGGGGRRETKGGEGAEWGDMLQQRYTRRRTGDGDGPGTADCVSGQPPSQPMGGLDQGLNLNLKFVS